jgi:hypothetical protein
VHEHVVGVRHLLADPIELLVAQVALRLGEGPVFLGLGVTERELPHHLETRGEAKIGRAGAEQIHRCEAEQRMVLEDLVQAAAVPDAGAEGRIEAALLDARVRLDGAHHPRNERGALTGGRLLGEAVDEARDVAMLLLQQIECIHAPSLPVPSASTAPPSPGG